MDKDKSNCVWFRDRVLVRLRVGSVGQNYEELSGTF